MKIIDKLLNKGKPKLKPLGFGTNRSEQVIKNMSRPILQYNLEGKLIKEWYGIKYATKTLGVYGINDCISGKTTTSGGFIWRYKDNPIDDGYTIPINKHSKRIIQYSKLGEYINTYDSITNAYLKTDINPGDISSCCLLKKKSAGSFLWRFEDNPLNNNYKFPKRKTRIILQYDLNNNLIEEWSGGKEIENVLGYNMRIIFQRCNDVLKHKYKNFIWKYK